MRYAWRLHSPTECSRTTCVQISCTRLGLPRLVFRFISSFFFIYDAQPFAVFDSVVFVKWNFVPFRPHSRHQIPIRRIMIHLCLFYHLMAKRKPLIPTVQLHIIIITIIRLCVHIKWCKHRAEWDRERERWSVESDMKSTYAFICHCADRCQR